MLRSLHSPDLGQSTFEGYIPPAEEDFVVFVQAEIGPSDGPGGEVFGVSVCSPDALARLVAPDRDDAFEFVRHRLVIRRWDPTVIRRAIEDLCVHTTGTSWADIAQKLGRLMHWEFEDYDA